jgi:hypothetical protein
LFAVLVGPICYFVLRKRERLYLLYFAAPCLALLVTLGLFVYALSADGIRTKVRTRELTWIDSQHQTAATQSRQTYYAVLGASRGIEVPKDTAVFPVRNSPAFERYYYDGRSARPGDYIVNDRQRLAGGFLPPRDQVQFLTTRPNQDPHSLSFTWTSSGGQVTNRVPFAIQRLLACDVNGKYWETDRIGSGETAVLRPSSVKVLPSLFTETIVPPDGSIPMLRRSLQQGSRAGVHISMLERRLHEWSTKLPTGHFVAIADLSQDLGIEQALVLNSAHVLMGPIP